ncbi:hypothetical protein BJY17_002837 [Agromyces hippuratus]|uniref:Uncharacterized protein n=1 Tax=Agromyces hippuratus TaxID=286438 RepID=A0A852X0P3_9MICO|nr:hypothetical protein [Agromyces hippuratus]NYG22090.1 hypothetical protein [Agromyces hippuratus]
MSGAFGSPDEALGVREDRRRGIRSGVASDLPVEPVETCPHAATAARGTPEPGVFVLDVVYILGIIAVFVLVGLIARGVEKL